MLFRSSDFADGTLEQMALAPQPLSVLVLAKVGGQPMPGQALLDASGRLLQWTTRCGTEEIVYTLDDPAMHRRERRGDRAPVQEGPLLIRPPWY